jgi:23S rRNA (uracil1939-C5)-methyltransferase
MAKSSIEQIEGVEIIDIGEQGQAIGKTKEGQVFLIQQAVPGDLMNIEVKKHRSRVSYAIPTQLVRSSPWRETPFCAHFGACGGCKWQHMKYEGQLKYKEKNVIDALHRLGGIADAHVRPIRGASEQVYYRNKLDFSFGNSRWLLAHELEGGQVPHRNGLGFHRPGSFEKIVDIQHCYLQADPSNTLRNFIRSFALEHHYTFYNVKNHTGLLRNMILRTALDGTTMLILVYGEANDILIGKLNEAICRQFPELIFYFVINQKQNDTIFDQTLHLVQGIGYLTESIGHLICRIGPKSFFQTNTRQATVLYEYVAELADLKGHEMVYDLYSGTGTIGLFLASKARKVIGIEEIQEAVVDAHINAQVNGIQNVDFHVGDVRKLLAQGFIDIHGRPDLIILDPPRSGLHPDNLPILLETGAPRLIYVSCNPATQARDLRVLTQKYKHILSQPVDMFPHTSHIENVTLLQRID